MERFVDRDLSGAEFRECVLNDVRLIGVVMRGARIEGDVIDLTVNGVEVMPYVEAELDRRHPERVQLRNVRNADDFRAMWATIERLWSELTARAERLPESVRHERVAEEWSFVETLRHLVFVTDAWVRRCVLGEASPYHREALPPTFLPDLSALGIEVGASVSLDEAIALRRSSQSVVDGVLAGLDQDGLSRVCAANPARGFPPVTEFPVLRCLLTVLNEESAHHEFAVRDLAVLEGRA
jgi:hypothetical protein